VSRSGYSDDFDQQWDLIRWRGAVASAIRGRRGQAFLREMLAALDAMPVKDLTLGALEYGHRVCAIGAVGRVRGVDMSNIDPEDWEQVARAFGISEALVREIAFLNDDYNHPGRRWAGMRTWVEDMLKRPAPEGGA
jgi:hypothetical protein